MSLQNARELEVTREKLAGLEKLYQTTSEAPTENNYARELTPCAQSATRSISSKRK